MQDFQNPAYLLTLFDMNEFVAPVKFSEIRTLKLFPPGSSGLSRQCRMAGMTIRFNY